MMTRCAGDARATYQRVAHALRMPPVDDWDTFPIRWGHATEAATASGAETTCSEGEGGVECEPCAAPDDDFMWTNERWRLRAAQPNGLPVVVLLEPREHYAEPGDLPEGLASELGVLIARIERAVRSVGDIGRVHVCRWGDGSEHLHWWFMARPARIPQLLGSFAAIWDDILPPTPENVWRANLEKVVRELSR